MEQMSFLEEDGDLDHVEFIPNRSAGLDRLNAFAPYGAAAYASRRNFDLGAKRRSNISALSPWVRHRLISEEEILREILKQHSLRSSEKFIQEVFWRSYFRGWLEQRPDVWLWYTQDLQTAIEQLEKDANLNQRYQEAVTGQTGLEAFDHWADELVETGYLHNHARMWFASIWIFTLRLPWVLGADFFYRYLMDGDPASNTCSWRWVGGLHTKGKNYAARNSNIARFTDGRFTNEMALAKDPLPLEDNREARLISPPIGDNLTDAPFALLLTEEDGLPETLSLNGKPTEVIGLLATADRSPLQIGEKASEFAQGAIQDTLVRAKKHFECPTSLLNGNDWANCLLEHAKANNIKTIVTAYAPVGPVTTHLQKAKNVLQENDIHLVQTLRPYDALAWPHATKGFFKLKKQIPKILDELQIS